MAYFLIDDTFFWLMYVDILPNRLKNSRNTVWSSNAFLFSFCMSIVVKYLHTFVLSISSKKIKIWWNLKTNLLWKWIQFLLIFKFIISVTGHTIPSLTILKNVTTPWTARSKFQYQWKWEIWYVSWWCLVWICWNSCTCHREMISFLLDK